MLCRRGRRPRPARPDRPSRSRPRARIRSAAVQGRREITAVDEQRRRDDVIDTRAEPRVPAPQGAAASGPHLDAEAAAAWMERRLDAAASRVDRGPPRRVRRLPGAGRHAGAHRRPAAGGAAAGAGWWSWLRRPWLVPAAAAAARRNRRVGRAAAARAGARSWRAHRRALEEKQSGSSRDGGIRSAAQDARVRIGERPRRRDAAPAPSREQRRDAARRGRGASARQSASQRPSRRLRGRRSALPYEAAGPAPRSRRPLDAPACTARPRWPARRQRRSTAGCRRRPSAGSESSASALPAPSTTPPASAARPARRGPERVGRRRTRPLATVPARSLEFAPGAAAPFAAAMLPLDAGALAAGSSPGGTVCWLVGPRRRRAGDDRRHPVRARDTRRPHSISCPSPPPTHAAPSSPPPTAAASAPPIRAPRGQPQDGRRVAVGR